MPREYVPADVVTVPDGDLPYLAARSALDLPDLLRAGCPPDPADDATQRELGLLRALAAGLRSLVARDAPVLPDRELRLELDRRLAQLDAALDDLGSAAPPASAAPRVATSLGPRPVRLRVALGWAPGGRHLTVGVTGHRADADRLPGEPDAVDLGGYHARLDWCGANDLLRAVRLGRDGACGAPE